jgi:hypothetical protein
MSNSSVGFWYHSVVYKLKFLIDFFAKCVKSSQGKIKSFKNRMGVNGLLICSKHDGGYRWKNIDGKMMAFKHKG